MVRVAPLDQLEQPDKKQHRTSTGSHDGAPRTSYFGHIPSDGVRNSYDGHGHHASLVKIAQHHVREVYLRAGWYDSMAALHVKRFVRSTAFSYVTMISLFVALFCHDVFVALQVSSNIELDVILTLVFAIFLFEFVGLTVTDTTYMLSFFFWMDLVGTTSMLFDISYMLGSDATLPTRVTDSDTNDKVIVARAARAVKLGARAGRLSRVLKILRFLPFLYNREGDRDKVKMARVISSRVNQGLSTRVAFLTICIVVMMPLFQLFLYPETDDGLTAWVELLARDAQDTASDSRLHSELRRFGDFFALLSYGPFSACHGRQSGNTFICEGVYEFDAPFKRPQRQASVREVSTAGFQVSYDLSMPARQEAAANVGLVVFVIIIMCGFGLVMSNSISVVALQPLERMLSVVRQRCKQIFKYTTELQEDDLGDDDEAEDTEEHASEFVLLEQVVAKLAVIAHLSTENKEPEVSDVMNEDDIMKINWMQGNQVPATGGKSTNGRMSMFYGNHTHNVDTTGEEASNGQGVPQVKLTAMRSIPVDVVHSVDSPYFDVLECQKELRISVALHFVLNSENCSSWVRTNVQEEKLVKFITTIEGNYLPNPFHSFAHAVDVLYSVSRFIKLTDADRFLTDISEFGLLIAAVSHDVGHLGVNNAYLVEIGHELAVKYNDRSPMENMHCAKLFQVVNQSDANIFSLVDKELYKEMRKGIITAILHTDMTMHYDIIKDLSLLYQMNSEAFDIWDTNAVNSSQQNVQLVLNALLHTADISNPMKPWELCHRYAYLCLDEFFAQGDKEKAAGIPVQMLNDRDKVNGPNSQVGFIEFVIAPLTEAMVNLFPQLDSLADHLAMNIQKWAEVWQKESTPPQSEIDKVNTRVQKVANRCQALMRTERVTDTLPA